MYFTDPQQLLDIFKQLEENNMFLIQNCQETERVLEELKVKQKETEEKLNEETANLQAHIEQLKIAIEKEELQSKLLKEKSQ